MTCHFYIKNDGEKSPDLPLFNEPGVSTVETDNIPGLFYPLESWPDWQKFMDEVGIETEEYLRWPHECQDFCTRRTSSGWPGLKLRNKVMATGCHLVPRAPRHGGVKGPKRWGADFLQKRKLETPLWRISFSQSEKILTNSFNGAQRRCFLLMKILFSVASNRLNENAEKILGAGNFSKFKFSSFLLKHTFFWALLDINQSKWRFDNLFNCMKDVLDKLYLQLAKQ